MMKFSNKKYVLIFALSIFISVTVLLGGSYALIQKVLVGTNTYAMRTGNFLVEFNESQEIALSNQVPVYDNVGMSTGDEFTFSVSNTGNYVSSYSVKIEQLSTDDLSSVVRYAIDYGDGYSYENIHALANNQYIIQNKSLAINGIDLYKLRFWLDIDASEEYIGKEFSAKVVIEATQEEYKYATNILESVYNLDEEGIVAIGSDGQLHTEGDIREYRYSGNSVNNYVWFNCDEGYTNGSDHCEKWRIIGSFENTYENGVSSYKMLKIVKDEVLDVTASYNTSGTANYKGSLIEKYLNYNPNNYSVNGGKNYYRDLLKSDAKKLIMKAKWNIGEVANTETTISNYYTEQNVPYYAEVALINASDFGYATSNTLWNTALNTTNITSENNWLYQDNFMILNTPDLNGENIYYISPNGLKTASVGYPYNIRPTLYLKPDVSIIAGYGTSEEPYELSIKFPMNYGVKTAPKAQEITYNLNGGIGTINSTLIGNKITSEIPVRENYTFLGWSTNPNATEAEYQSGADYAGQPVTLYAVWGEKLKLYDAMQANAVMDNIKSDFVGSTTGIDFSTTSSTTNGQGVYKRAGTENDEYPILYYRGNVDNNNVIFADFCWKIVRTTDTGGIKLIYNGVPTNGQCNNTGTASQLANTTPFNSSPYSPAYNGYMYGTVYTYMSGSPISGAYFGNSFKYENGVYTLVDTSQTLDATHHYTCNKTTADGTCSTIRYYYYTGYYINIKDGKGVEEAIAEMQTNSVDSKIKETIDNWYKSDDSKMTQYTKYLEDTIWCNDRRMNTNTNGWNPNGGSLSEYFYYAPYGRASETYEPSLTCSKNDAFTIKETEIGNGNLDYPVALLTNDEIMLAGGSNSSNSSYYLYTGQGYWSVSPYNFDNTYARSFYIYSDGGLGENGLVRNANGVRPAVSLVQGIRIERGTGTVGDPYIIKY